MGGGNRPKFCWELNLTNQVRSSYHLSTVSMYIIELEFYFMMSFVHFEVSKLFKVPVRERL